MARNRGWVTSPLLHCLKDCQSVLLVGAGGGYDVYCGLPLYRHLKARGKQVHLASLNFSQPTPEWGRSLSQGLVEVRAPATIPAKIGAETSLALWFASRAENVPVYRFEAGGVQQLLAHYQFLQQHLKLDALVLIDGGTDILLRGDEPGLGSPSEDVASLAAAHLLQLPTKLVTCLGFCLDAHHHVCHAYVLEAAAELTRSGDFLGVMSLLPDMPEFKFFREAVHFAAGCKEARVSIIASSVLAAGQGEFGNYHASPRTHGSTLLINPLMSMYWSFQVDGLARRCLYLDSLLPTRTRGEVTLAIRRYRDGITPRPWLQLPL